MPAQKRSREASPPPTTEEEEEKDDDLHPENQNQNDEEADEGDDSDESSSSSDAEKDEFITLRLSEIRKEVQCPICLGIIRKTRTVMECLHRFCRECIDKSMRMGNNECPACRTHCASRRSLRDDPNYDALIAILYPDIDKYEEEELAFHEEEMVRNKQIQASIAQTLRRQTEALGRKRTSRATPPAFIRRSGNRNLRRRRNQRIEPQGSDDDEDANGHDDKDSSSGDDHSAEVKPKRPKRLGGRFSQGSTAGSANAGCDENDSEMNRESLGATALIGSSEILAWGKGGMRSQKTQNRYSSLGGRNGRLCRSSRVSKLIESLQHSNENDAKVDIGLMLVSLCEEDIPSLQRPYLCCRPTLTVKHLIQYVSLQTSIQADEIDMLVMKEPPPTDKPSSSEAVPITKSVAGVPCNSEFDKLQEHQTLEEIQPSCGFSQCNLLLAYRRKPKE
ncbi:putative E3 ubiquitin-protein ligase RING1a isoform X2 [Ipomoea triloba]|uniref:putative E3 ubiquitin-protein ligase RING1a isoform X2 n=1 Tax=Ipomoea triloba TaxID=35885 RepID=UPI00125D8AEB|nr:putative E3 ubiquitin-protein ligase RING1a isoform X2 [Ipomoea triloba]